MRDWLQPYIILCRYIIQACRYSIYSSGHFAYLTYFPLALLHNPDVQGSLMPSPSMLATTNQANFLYIGTERIYMMLFMRLPMLLCLNYLHGRKSIAVHICEIPSKFLLWPTCMVTASMRARVRTMTFTHSPYLSTSNHSTPAIHPAQLNSSIVPSTSWVSSWVWVWSSHMPGCPC